MKSGWIIGGTCIGLVLAGAGHAGAVALLGGGMTTALIVGTVAALIGSIYSGIAFAKGIYEARFLSLFGYILDMTWSLLNTAAALLVWLPISALKGGSLVTPNADTKRSGTFVYTNNPRGGGYAATTIGTVIAGGWDSHEETHVWQARMFGPLYLIGYGFAWLWMLLFRAVIFRLNAIDREAYGRICFEDWAYWGGGHSASIKWGPWIGGMGLSLLFVGMLTAVVVGASTGMHAVWAIALGGLAAYGLIRALAPSSSH